MKLIRRTISSYLVALAPLILGISSLKAEADTIYSKIVQPILEARCVECHNEKKQKGKLRLDTPEHIKKGEVVVAGKSSESELVVRVTLPEDDGDLMPPKGDPLTKAQIAALRWWIDKKEASYDAQFVLADAPDELKKLAESGAVPKVVKAKEPELPVVDAAKPELMKTLKDMGVLVLPLAQNTNLLHVESVSVAKDVKDEHLALLKPLAPQLAWLYLNKTGITDAGLKHLSGLKQLRRLHLANTAITDAGIKNLAGLENLETLNIYGTKVTTGVLDTVAKLPKLKKVFLYNTDVEPRSAFRFLNKNPNLDVNLGWDFEALKQLDSGLVLHETFEDKHQGQLQGGKVKYEDGPAGKAVALDDKAFIVAGDLGNFERTEAFSVVSWVKGEQGVIAARADTSDEGRGWTVKLGKDSVGFDLVSNGPDNAIKVHGDVKFSKDEWYLVAATYDGSGKAAGVKLFVDGAPVEPKVDQDNLTRTTKTYQVMTIGRQSGGPTFKSGQLDDLRLYPTALSSDQVGALFDRYAFKVIPAGPVALNSVCPISGNAIDPQHTLVYSKTVGVCCENCKGKLESDPLQYATIIANVNATHINTKCPLSGKDSLAEHTVEHNGSKVAFCCPNCPDKFDSAKHGEKVLADRAGNATCPFSGKENTKIILTAIPVGVCCDKCKASFEKSPEVYIRKVTAGETAPAKKEARADKQKVAEVKAKKQPALKKEQTVAEVKAKKQPALKKEQAVVVAANKLCPLSGKPIDPTFTTVYAKSIGVCCNNCKGKLDRNPGKFIDQVATVKAAHINSKCPLSGKDVIAEHIADFNGSKVAFCCPNCPSKFDEAEHASKVLVDHSSNNKCVFSGKANKAYSLVSINVGVCCGKCKAAFDKEPDENILKVSFGSEVANLKAEQAASKAVPKTSSATLIALLDDSSCCHKANAKGEACKHPCCVKATAKSTVCLKCNPKAEASLVEKVS